MCDFNLNISSNNYLLCTINFYGSKTSRRPRAEGRNFWKRFSRLRRRKLPPPANLCAYWTAWFPNGILLFPIPMILIFRWLLLLSRAFRYISLMSWYSTGIIITIMLLTNQSSLPRNGRAYTKSELSIENHNRVISVVVIID